MNILVTGGYGQLGCEIQQVVHTDNTITDAYYFYNSSMLDITDTQSVLDAINRHHIDVLVNCAAYTNVNEAEYDSTKANSINYYGVGVLANVCKEKGIKLIHISTDYVFDGCKNTPYKPNDKKNPLNEYGSSKSKGEDEIIEIDPDYMIFRTSWLYSIYKNNFCLKMFKTFARDYAPTKNDIKVVYDQVGSPTNARDLAKFIVYIIRKKLFIKGVYHFANKGVASWYDVAKVIYNECKGPLTPYANLKECTTQDFVSIVKRPPYSVLDCSDIEKCFLYEIPYWLDSLNKWLEEVKNNY